MQQLQLTTWGDNIHAVEVDGTFDDCQRMVKQLLADQTIQKTPYSPRPTASMWRDCCRRRCIMPGPAAGPETGKPVVISVPSGNFGNLTAGLLARRMGIGPDFLLQLPMPTPLFPTTCKQAASKPGLRFLRSAMPWMLAIQAISNACCMCLRVSIRPCRKL